VRERDVEVLGLQGRDGVVAQVAVRARDPDRPGAPAAPELQAEDGHEDQREDEDEEDVRGVADEAEQLRARDRDDGPHSAVPLSGMSREIAVRTTANPSIVTMGIARSASDPPPAVIPRPRMNAEIG